MQVTDELIRSVVQEVLSHMRNGQVKPTNGHARRWGVFDDVPGAVAAATEAYAAYLNTPRGILDADEQQLFDEDLAKARAAMENAWLEALPVGPAR